MIARIKTNLIKYFFFGNSITNDVLEMNQRLDGVWVETDEDKELQERFHTLRASVPKFRFHESTRIGAGFLRRYKHLL